MESNRKFHNDLRAGQKGERLAAKLMQKIEGADEVDFRFAGKRHDFVLEFWDGRKISYEIKCDFASQRTGNLFFEFECSRIASGLAATKANKWAIVLEYDNVVLVFRPRIMLNWLIRNKYKKVFGGDNRSARGYLVPVWDVVNSGFVQEHLIKKNASRRK